MTAGHWFAAALALAVAAIRPALRVWDRADRRREAAREREFRRERNRGA